VCDFSEQPICGQPITAELAANLISCAQGAEVMDIYDSLFSPESVLNEQVARQIFGILPENGPVFVIMDKDRNCWPSDSEKFSNLHIDTSFLTQLCAKVDDGHEPIVTQVNDCSVVAVQLRTEKTNCGYAIVALPDCNPESTLVNINLVEIILNQIGLIARLIEKNNLLYELGAKQLSGYGSGETASN